jgi:GR25 family glycosyltransferase involved in LPS biosynthesis
MQKPIVISLLEQTERKLHIQKYFPEYEVFHAINGKKFRLKHGILTPEAIACFLSHTTLWLQLLNQEEEFFFIIEDDAKPKTGLAEIESKLQSLPEDWDIAFLGWNYSLSTEKTIKKINENWMTCDAFWGLQAYVIRKSSIKKIYQKLLNMDTHIDIQLARLIQKKHINGYFLNESLIVQESLESQIPKKLEKKK